MLDPDEMKVINEGEVIENQRQGKVAESLLRIISNHHQQIQANISPDADTNLTHHRRAFQALGSYDLRLSSLFEKDDLEAGLEDLGEQ